jgi:hypothetical protein
MNMKKLQMQKHVLQNVLKKDPTVDLMSLEEAMVQMPGNVYYTKVHAVEQQTAILIDTILHPLAAETPIAQRLLTKIHVME